MKDVCWIHNQTYALGDFCPDCMRQRQEYQESSFAEIESPLKEEEESGDRLKGVVKIFGTVFLALIVAMVLVSVLTSR